MSQFPKHLQSQLPAWGHWGTRCSPRGNHVAKALPAVKDRVPQGAGPASVLQPALETGGGRWQLSVQEDRTPVCRGAPGSSEALAPKQSALGNLSLCFRRTIMSWPFTAGFRVQRAHHYTMGWLSWQRIHLQCRRPRFDSFVGMSPWRGERLPTPVFLGFPCGSAGKESSCNAGDPGSTPLLG